MVQSQLLVDFQPRAVTSVFDALPWQSQSLLLTVECPACADAESHWPACEDLFSYLDTHSCTAGLVDLLWQSLWPSVRVAADITDGIGEPVARVSPVHLPTAIPSSLGCC